MTKFLSRLSIILFSMASISILSGCNFEKIKNDFFSIFTRKENAEENKPLTLEQLTKYKQLTSALISLDEKFIDELESASAADRQEILTTMRTAQEKLVQKYGFKSFDEYIWIDSVALKNPANAAIAKEAGIEIIQTK